MAGLETRKQRERRQHCEEILAAAFRLFARNGFEGTTMAEIAAETEFAVGTLYTFFKDKEDLYGRIILRIGEEFDEACTAALEAPGSGTDKIERYIDAHIAMFVKHAAVGRYFILRGGAFVAPLGAVDRVLRDRFERTLKTLAGILERGMREKIFAPMNPRMLALALEGLINSFIPALAEDPEAFSAEEMSDVVRKVFFERVRL